MPGGKPACWLQRFHSGRRHGHFGGGARRWVALCCAARKSPHRNDRLAWAGPLPHERALVPCVIKVRPAPRVVHDFSPTPLRWPAVAAYGCPSPSRTNPNKGRSSHVCHVSRFCRVFSGISFLLRFRAPAIGASASASQAAGRYDSPHSASRKMMPTTPDSGGPIPQCASARCRRGLVERQPGNLALAVAAIRCDDSGGGAEPSRAMRRDDGSALLRPLARPTPRGCRCVSSGAWPWHGMA